MMLKKYIIVPAMFLIILISGCNSTPKVYMNASHYNSIKKLCAKTKPVLIVYYYDGDCSLCIAKVKFLDSKFRDSEDTNTVFISKTLNPSILKFNLDNLKLHSCLYDDQKNDFSHVLKLNQVLKINSDRSFEEYIVE